MRRSTRRSGTSRRTPGCGEVSSSRCCGTTSTSSAGSSRCPGQIGQNVAMMARPPRARAARAKTYPTWTADQLARFLTEVDETEHAAVWNVAAYTGLRRGELVALLWDDVDLERGILTVSR